MLALRALMFVAGVIAGAAPVISAPTVAQAEGSALPGLPPAPLQSTMLESWLGGLEVSPHVVNEGQPITETIGDPPKWTTGCIGSNGKPCVTGFDWSPQGEVVSGCKDQDTSCVWKATPNFVFSTWSDAVVSIGNYIGGATSEGYYYVIPSGRVISGTVVAPDGKGVNDVHVEISGPTSGYAVTNASGFYDAKVKPGTYSVGLSGEKDYQVTSCDPGGKTGGTACPLDLSSPVSGEANFSLGGCSNEAGVADGSWEFGGCFRQPDSVDYNTVQPSQLDGLRVSPTTRPKQVDYTNGGGADDVASRGTVTVALNLDGVNDQIWRGHLNWDLGGKPISLAMPKGAGVAGFPLLGDLQLAPASGGSVTVTGKTDMPSVLGNGTATISITSVFGKGITQMEISADKAIVGKLFSVTQPSLTYKDGTWSLAGTVSSASAGATFSGQLSYDQSGNLTSAKISLQDISLGGLWNLKSFTFDYSKSAGTGTWALSGTTSGTPATALTGDMSFDRNGTVTAAHLDGTNLSFGNLFDMQHAELTYEQGGKWGASGHWGDEPNPSKFSGDLVFRQGSLTDGSLTVTNVSLEGLFQVESATLSINGAGNAGGGASWHFDATVAPPGPGKAPVALTGSEVFDPSGTMTTGNFTGRDMAVAQLFELDSFAFTYANTNNVQSWGLAAQGKGSNGQSVSFTGSVTYNGQGVPISGDFECSNIVFANLITIKTFTLSYKPATGWTGSADLAQEQTGQAAQVSLTINNDGVLTSGSFHAQKVDLFGVLNLDKFDFTYDPKNGWALSVETTMNKATVGTGLTVLDGVITEAHLNLANITFADKLTIDDLGLTYQQSKQGTQFSGSAEVTLPGPAGPHVAGGFTFVNDSFQSGFVKIDGLNVALGYGIFLNSIDAKIAVTAPDQDGNVQPQTLGGGMGVTVGPQVEGRTAIKVAGDVTYDFPVNGQVERWDIKGTVSVADHALGTGELVVSQGSSPGPTGCPAPAGASFAALGVSLGSAGVGLQIGPVTIKSQLCGTFGPNFITATGTAEVDVNGDVLQQANASIDQNGIAACGTFPGHQGSYGFVWSWSASLPTAKLGDCSLSGF